MRKFVLLTLLTLFALALVACDGVADNGGEREWAWSYVDLDPFPLPLYTKAFADETETIEIIIRPLDESESIVVYGHFAPQIETTDQIFQEIVDELNKDNRCFSIGIKGPTEGEVILRSVGEYSLDVVHGDFSDSLSDTIQLMADIYLRHSEKCTIVPVKTGIFE